MTQCGASSGKIERTQAAEDKMPMEVMKMILMNKMKSVADSRQQSEPR